MEFVGCNPATLIVFKLWDWDRFSSNDIIGEYRTSLADVLAASPPNQEWESPGDGVEVEWGGEVSARLRLKTRWRPRSAGAAGGAAGKAAPPQGAAAAPPAEEEERLAAPSGAFDCGVGASPAAEATLAWLQRFAPAVLSSGLAAADALAPYGVSVGTLHLAAGCVAAFALGRVGADVAWILPLNFLVRKVRFWPRAAASPRAQGERGATAARRVGARRRGGVGGGVGVLHWLLLRPGRFARRDPASGPSPPPLPSPLPPRNQGARPQPARAE
jgi:hypothetical protein